MLDGVCAWERVENSSKDHSECCGKTQPLMDHQRFSSSLAVSKSHQPSNEVMHIGIAAIQYSRSDPV